MSRLHIAIAFGTLNTGGAEKVMIRLANGFAERNIKITIIVLDDHGSLKNEVEKEIEIISLNVRRARHGIKRFRKFLIQEKPAIVIAAQTHIQLMTLLAANFSEWNGKIILNEHSVFSHNNKSSFNRLLARILFRHANAITAVSEAVKTDFEKVFGRKAIVIQNAAYDPRILELSNLTDGSIPGEYILAVGRLTASKNYKLLIDAFAILIKTKSCRLVFAGDGEARNQLEKYAQSRNILHLITFLGNVSNPYTLMRKSKTLVMTSLYEGLPTVLIEALACCCNIVCVDGAGGSFEIISEQQLGTFVRNNATDLAAGIINSFDSEKHCDHKLAKAKEFSVDIAVDKYLELIGELT
jgi:glycosyltransferase involved in cell wall biosynthesis